MTWQEPITSQSLKTEEVDLWKISKYAHENKLESYWAVLNKEEKEKALRFRFTKDRNCAIIARGILRHLISTYIELKPEHINFKFGKNGKPFIDKYPIKFNVSHSADSIIIAFTKSHIIGVDVECTERDLDIKSVARSFFSDIEVKRLLKLDKEMHKQAFYNCWTRKEAFIKAEGSGLSFPLKEFSVSLESTTDAELIETHWDQKEKNKWTLSAFTPAKNYIGALAVKGKIEKINYYCYK